MNPYLLLIHEFGNFLLPEFLSVSSVNQQLSKSLMKNDSRMNEIVMVVTIAWHREYAHICTQLFWR